MTTNTDADSPWKDILRAYFPQAMQFFFPNTSALIDWSKSHEFLDKEFQKISQDAELGRRYAESIGQSLAQNRKIDLAIGALRNSKSG